jgi:hypothetical protein
MKAPFSLSAAAALFFGLALVVHAQEGNKPESTTSRHYSLTATPDNVQWGWYDPKEKPRFTIHSGDTVSIETLSHSLGQIKPGIQMDEIMKLRKANDGGGPHSITGPIYVGGAEPGDTLEIRILKIVPKPDALISICRGKIFPLSVCCLPNFPKASSVSTNWISPKCRRNSSRELSLILSPFQARSP